jgi:hypothetical protein
LKGSVSAGRGPDDGYSEERNFRRRCGALFLGTLLLIEAVSILTVLRK